MSRYSNMGAIDWAVVVAAAATLTWVLVVCCVIVSHDVVVEPGGHAHFPTEAHGLHAPDFDDNGEDRGVVVGLVDVLEETWAGRMVLGAAWLTATADPVCDEDESGLTAGERAARWVADEVFSRKGKSDG